MVGRAPLATACCLAARPLGSFGSSKEGGPRLQISNNTMAKENMSAFSVYRRQSLSRARGEDSNDGHVRTIVLLVLTCFTMMWVGALTSLETHVISGAQYPTVPTIVIVFCSSVNLSRACGRSATTGGHERWFC